LAFVVRLKVFLWGSAQSQKIQDFVSNQILIVDIQKFDSCLVVAFKKPLKYYSGSFLM
jgi:hypothetical protein